MLGMGNKCKICGYRFKSRDEEICPECFTAREDDISCERYSGKDHTHRKTTYAGDFMETGESFVQRELRQERNNAFARENFGARANAGLDLSRSAPTYDRSRFVRDDYNYDFSKEYSQIMAQSYPNHQPPQQRSQTVTFNAASGFSPSAQPFAQRNAVRAQYAANNRKKKGNAVGAVVFLMLMVMIFIVAAVLSTRNDRNSSYSSRKSTTTTRQRNTTTTAATTKKTTTQGTTSKLKEGVKAVNSSLGHFSAEITDAVFEKKNRSDIADKSLLSASSNHTQEKEPWEIVTFTITLSTTDKAPADPKNTVISTTTLQCIENESAHDTMSYSVSSQNGEIDLSDGKVNTTVTLLAHKDAKVMYFSLYLKNSGVTEVCRFTISR